MRILRFSIGKTAAVALSVSLALSTAACSDSGSNSGTGGSAPVGGASGGAGTGGTRASGGTAAGTTNSGGSTSPGGSTSGGSVSGGQGGVTTGGAATGGAATGGAAGGGTAAGASGGGAGGAAGSSNGGTSAGGASSGGGGGGTSAGGATSGGAANGGMSQNGGAGGTSAGGAAGGGGTAGASGGSGGGSSGACPADAFFCSDFEEAALPAKATYSSNIQTPVEVVLDKTKHHSGSQSVKVNKGSGYVYRMLSVPAAQKFWFRAYVMTDVPIDSAAKVHESFMGANWGMDKGVDIVQEQCQVAININDNPVLGSNGMNPPINCPADGQKMSANTWYCFEGSFDGSTGNLEIFVDGKSIIKGNAVSQAKQQFTNFRFGYVEYNGTNRTVWYDDVATGPTRIPCSQ
ncbi:MAG TPA: hypothetical protein VFQ61_35240 [Polyangiaceae bacterium]|nr:hypothetical protein [Polyangiaceae bacterium]